jgi:hypothetical protein
MHIFQTLQLDTLVTLSTDIVDESLDVISQLTKATVSILLEEIILDL